MGRSANFRFRRRCNSSASVPVFPGSAIAVAKEERVYLRQRAYLYARMGRRSEAERDLAESLRLSRGKQVSSGVVALVYAMLGRKDKSFEWLNSAYAEGSSFMTTLKLWPAFDAMRGDPRFSEVLREIGLPE